MKSLGSLLVLFSVAYSSQLGAWDSVPTNDPDARVLAKAFVQDQNVQSNSLFLKMFLKLTSVKVKVCT